MFEKFQRFHKANPGVYELFCLYAMEAIAAGHTCFSADAIAHRIRWNRNVESSVRGKRLFVLNNNHVAFYARKWLEDHPQYPNFFELRVSEADRGAA